MPDQVDSLVAIHHQHDKNVWLFLFIGISKKYMHFELPRTLSKLIGTCQAKI
jgi:hypothetical protein